MRSASNQTGEMRHIYEKDRTAFVRDFTEFSKIKLAGIGGMARYEQFRFAFQGNSPDFSIIQ